MADDDWARAVDAQESRAQTVGACGRDAGDSLTKQVDGLRLQQTPAKIWPPTPSQSIRSPDSQPIRSPASQPIRSPASESFRSPASQPIRSPASQPIRSPDSQPNRSPISEPSYSPAANTSHSSQSSGDEDKAPTKAESSELGKILRSGLVTTKSDLEVLQKDPNSPLYSVKTFQALHLKPELLKGIYAMGFNAPSKIQETALPTLLADPPTNMIAQSQSGTGKTAAFVLTMLSRVDTRQDYPQCLCLAPTYELALQIGRVTEEMARYMGDLRVQYAVRGGERLARGEKVTAHIVIGTPGTVLDWVVKYKFFDTKKISVFVLDEADVMIDTQGHQDQSIRIQRGLRTDCQMLLFSATYDSAIMKFAHVVVNNPVTIRLRKEEESLKNIRQYYIMCGDKEDKLRYLSNIYGSISIGQTMIFCHTRRTANWLCEKLTEEGHSVALLSGELDVQQRAAIIHRFREGKEKVLVTTNVSARGIDVEQVTVVVNFDLPIDQFKRPCFETYLHRIGRTGRFGKSGLALNMVDGTNSMHMIEAIQEHFGQEIQKLNADDIDELEQLNNNNF